MEKKVKMVKDFILCISIFLSTSHTIKAVSFDCTKTKSKVEYLICDSLELSDLDSQLDEKYRKKLTQVANPKALQIQQHTWLLNVRNRCVDVNCLQKVYKKRINDLEDQCAYFQQLKANPTKIKTEPSAEHQLGVVCNPKYYLPSECKSENITLEGLKMQGLSSEDPVFLKLLNDPWSITASLVDINNDGLNDVRLYRMVGTAHCTESYFFAKTNKGTLQFISNPEYETFHEEGRFCDGKMMFIRYKEIVYSLEIYGDGDSLRLDTVWLGSKDGLRKIYILR